MQLFRWLTLLSVLCVSYAVWGQDTCPVIVKTALDATSDACDTTARNQACYGNIDISATLREGSVAEFAQVGDIANVLDIETIALKPLDETLGTWGVALLRLQANLPDALPGQNVTMILFGDVSLTSEVSDEEKPQAFYFSSGIGDSPCAEAPTSGILIQSPQGAGTVELTLNGVNITMGSTLYFNGAPDNNMTIAVLEGEATLTLADETVTIPAGSESTVALDDDGTATGAFTEPTPFEPATYATLPTLILPEAFEVGTTTTNSTGVTVTGSDITGEWEVSFRDGEQSAGCIENTLQFFAASIGDQPLIFTADEAGNGFTIDTFVAVGIDTPLTRDSTGMYVLETTPSDPDYGIFVTSTAVFLSPTTVDFFYEVKFDIEGYDCSLKAFIDGVKSGGASSGTSSTETNSGSTNPDTGGTSNTTDDDSGNSSDDDDSEEDDSNDDN